MIINQYLCELKYRSIHTLLITILTTLQIFLISDYIVEMLIFEIKKFEEYNEYLIISADLTHILISKITIVITLFLINFLISCYIEYISFIKNALYKYQYKLKLKKSINNILYTIFILYVTTTNVIYTINKTLVKYSNNYEIFKIQTIINLKDFLIYYIITLILLYIIGIILINIFSKKIYKIKYYTIFYLIIAMVTPPDILLHIKIIIPFILLLEMVNFIKIINKNKLKFWKRLDSNQRSIKQ
jgi:sec-independent protein translocase protein TatC